MIRRLRLKFIAITMTLVTVMLIFILGLQYRSAQATLEAVSIQALKSAAENGDNPFRPGMGEQNSGAPCFSLSQTHRGDLLISGDAYYDLTDTNKLISIFQQAWEMGSVSGVLKDDSLRFYRTENVLGVKFVFTDITSEQQTLARLIRNNTLIGIAAFLAFLVLCSALARWAIRPVEKAWQQQRQFVADASHELKTPLTVILTNAELLQDERYDEAEKHRLAVNIQTMSQQMRGLVESLLQLARADNADSRAEKQTMDYSRLVLSGVLPFEPVYFEQGLTLDSRVEEGIFVNGDSRQLGQVLSILLDNGCKYSAPGSTVTLSLSRQGRGKCLLTLDSPGTPMSRETCRDIYKRFYRADEARAMNHSYGLGLSIAQEIVESHRGKIWTEPGESSNVFYVALPTCLPFDE